MLDDQTPLIKVGDLLTHAESARVYVVAFSTPARRNGQNEELVTLRLVEPEKPTEPARDWLAEAKAASPASI